MGRQTCEQRTSGDFGNNRSDKPKSMKSRLPFLVNGWPTDVVYDAKEEVATIEQSSQEAAHCCCGLAGSAGRTGLLRAGWGCWCGSVALPLSRGHSRQVSNLLLLLWLAGAADANGKVELVSGPIQPIDVLSSNGRRYFVEFNELHQPLRKGGHILEEEHGKPMGLIEAWERSHAKVETMKLSAPSTSCKEDLEDEAFHDVMNGGKIPERPQVLGVMRNGNASVQLIDAAQSTLAMATQQVDASDNDAPRDDGSRVK
ncbi:Polycystic kidney disease 1-related protein [Bienertia sinuspersici]